MHILEETIVVLKTNRLIQVLWALAILLGIIYFSIPLWLPCLAQFLCRGAE